MRTITNNGTNFIDSEWEFKKYIATWNKEIIEEHSVQQGIRWKCNPLALHPFEGKWKKQGGSSKKAMHAVFGNPFITEHVVLTAMCLVEQILKARPVIPVIFDVNDLQAITPKHSLLGNRIIPLSSLSLSLSLSLSKVYIMRRVVCWSLDALPMITSLLESHLGDNLRRKSVNFEQLKNKIFFLFRQKSSPILVEDSLVEKSSKQGYRYIDQIKNHRRFWQIISTRNCPRERRSLQ